MIFRVVLFRLCGAALVSVAAAACAGLQAPQPQQSAARDQAWGFYRVWLSDFEVTALSDPGAS